MKRFFLSAVVVLLGMSTLVPMASANSGERGSQVSTTREVSESASLIDLVRHNRAVRNK
ncbi:MAG: hypothetical protein HC800_17020 [Phormidesmis sp. RL_2_1]|nr:hypothetical protein [Phormidesmis sp. RL_2_1]